MNAVLRAFQDEPESVWRLLDFLPYPFLISTKIEGVQTNIFLNKRFVEEIGYTMSEIPTLEHWFLLAYPDEGYRDVIRNSWISKVAAAIQNGDDSVVSRARIYTRTKGYQWYEVKSSFTGNLEFVAFLNVNEVIERDLELQRLNENKNKILSILGHDLRSPIVNLNTLTDYMLKANLNQDEFIEHVNRVHELSKSSLQFLETTLLWTRSNFERVTPKRDKLHLREWLDQLLAIYKPNIDQKQLTFEVSVSNDATLVTDGEILHIVLRNLLSNAIKFSKPNSKIFIGFERDQKSNIIQVKDTGSGMSAEIIDALMHDQFDTGNVARLPGGFGIGLRLCKDVLRGLGGELKMVSKLTEGTTVSVFLPVG